MTENQVTETVEAWAERKGMLPQWFKTKARVGGREAEGRRQNPKYVDFVQAKALRGWPEGREVSEADFDAAVTEAKGIEIR